MPDRPATREYAFEVTVAAGTAVAAPFTQQLSFNPGEVVQVEIIVPDGAAGLAGIALGMSGTTIIPIQQGQYFVGNGEPIVRQLEGYPNSGRWEARAYNTDRYVHTFQVRFSVKEIPEAPPTGAAGAALALTETGEISTTPIEAGTGETGKPGEAEETETGGGEPPKQETPVEAEPPEAGEAAPPAPEEPPEVPESAPPEPGEPAEVPGEGGSLGEFGGVEQGAEPGEPGGEGESSTPIEVTGEHEQPVSAAGRHAPKKKKVKKHVKKTVVKRGKAAPKRHAAPKRKATKKAPATHKKVPAKHATTHTAPHRTAAHHATHPTAHRAARSAAPAHHAAAPHAAAKAKPKAKATPTRRPAPPPPPPPAKRAPATPAKKRRKS